MQAIPLGKIQVPTPGTPVGITLAMLQAAAVKVGATLASLPQLIHKIEAWADPADGGVTYVKTAIALGGTLIAALPMPANGHAEHWHACCDDGNAIDIRQFAVDAVNANNGPIVTAWID